MLTIQQLSALNQQNMMGRQSQKFGSMTGSVPGDLAMAIMSLAGGQYLRQQDPGYLRARQLTSRTPGDILQNYLFPNMTSNAMTSMSPQIPTAVAQGTDIAMGGTGAAQEMPDLLTRLMAFFR